MKPIRTIQDLLDSLNDLGYSPSTINQIRPRLKECARIYNAPLDRIPADLGQFEERWGRGRIAALAEGFKSQDHFVEWRKRVRGALGKAAGPQPEAELLPDWTRLSSYVQENGGVGCLLGPHREIGVTALGKMASRDRIEPFDLTQDWINVASKPLQGKARRTFKRGIDALIQLVDTRDEHVEIADLLPPQALAQPERAVLPPSPWRRGHFDAAELLWADFDAFVAKKRGVDAFGRPIPADKSEFKSRTEETYANALNLATGLLAGAGDMDPTMEPRLADICNPATIARVANLWHTRALNGEVRADATTRKMMVARLSHIAEFFVGLKKAERKQLAKVKKQVRKTSPKSDTMSPPRLRWIKAFAKSPAQQRAVHRMPEELQKQSMAILRDWKNLKHRKRHKQRMRALSLGIAAVQAAILFRGSAIRAGNLRGLTFRGPEAQLFLDAEGRDVDLSIPAHLVKNNVDIEAEFDPDARPIIDWYLTEIRPRLIGDHPYGRKLVDSDFLFPSTRADNPMEQTTFAGHYATGCEAVGLKMTLHQARQVTGYFILSINPSAIALVAAVLCDSVDVVMKHYAWMDGVKAGREARELLRQARAEARRHRRGTYADAA